MKLLLIGPKVDSLDQIVNFSGVWAYHLAREFRRAGVDLIFEPQDLRPDIVDRYDRIDLRGVDHVLSLGLAWFDRIPADCAASLRSRIRGLVTQIHDRPSRKDIADLTFGIRNRPTAERYHCIGWAADPEILWPAQVPGECRILIDHPDYGARKTDRTKEIVQDALVFAQLRRTPPKIVVRQIRDGGFVDCTGRVPPYSREHVPYPEACAEYARCDIFMVTHPESVGLTALECATAGALVVTPKDFIGADLLKTIRHVSYTGHIPWPSIMRSLDAEKSREIASANNWRTVAGKILAHLC